MHPNRFTPGCLPLKTIGMISPERLHVIAGSDRAATQSEKDG